MWWVVVLTLSLALTLTLMMGLVLKNRVFTKEIGTIGGSPGTQSVRVRGKVRVRVRIRVRQRAV